MDTDLRHPAPPGAGDDHVGHAVALTVLAVAVAGDTLGASRLRAQLPFVRDHGRLR
ncbi:hypothetical protein [Streptomyces sp. NPDC001315]|uniref:hypothetical protein n=1 Tax=Streptomyces sp. NPDC001315 TaxID=3364562 RepID=UPI0036A826E0